MSRSSALSIGASMLGTRLNQSSGGFHRCELVATRVALFAGKSPATSSPSRLGNAGQLMRALPPDVAAKAGRAHTTRPFPLLWRITINADPSAKHERKPEKYLCHARRQEPRLHLCSCKLAVSFVGLPERNDRRH